MNDRTMNFDLDKENLTVTISRSFEAPLDLVWAAWTQAELLDQWWGPKPCVAETKEMNFTVGGRWLYAMVIPGVGKKWDSKTFLTIEPKSGFTYRSAFCDENGDVDPETKSSVWENSFVEKDGITTVTNVIRNDSLERLEMMIKMGFKEGYTMGLDQLEALLATMPQAG
jgi:uncharacterized protein YndB with AHSA1/START domain